MYKWLVILITVFVFSGPIDAQVTPDDNFVVILQCTINDEVVATISNLVLAGQPTEHYKVETLLSGTEIFNTRPGLNVHERFTQICSDALTGEVTRMVK